MFFVFQLGIGLFVFILSTVMGQIAWRRTRKFFKRSVFKKTAACGEPTLVGITTGLVVGTGAAIGTFYGLEPQALNNFQAVVGISVCLSLLTFSCCFFCVMAALHSDLFDDDGGCCGTAFVCCCSGCCGVFWAIAMGMGLAYGLRRYVIGTTPEQFHFNTTSVALAAVIAIVLLAGFGFFLKNGACVCVRPRALHCSLAHSTGYVNARSQ